MPGALLVAILAVSAVATSFVSGVLGMAGGMILMGVLLAVMPVPAAMMLHGITQLAANGWRALMWRRSVDWPVFGGYALGAVVAVAAFASVQLVVAKPTAYIILGLTPFASLLLPARLHLNVERRGHPFACGVVCSMLSLSAGVAGPMLDVFFVRSRMGRQAVVATKAMTQSLSHLLKIAYFGAIAAGATAEPAIAAMMVVLAFAGTSLSARVLERMSDDSFRRWTRATVMSLGAVYLAAGTVLLLR